MRPNLDNELRDILRALLEAAFNAGVSLRALPFAKRMKVYLGSARVWLLRYVKLASGVLWYIEPKVPVWSNN
jgi:hypothetical protein